jgi:hypothetical protein
VQAGKDERPGLGTANSTSDAVPDATQSRRNSRNPSNYNASGCSSIIPNDLCLSDLHDRCRRTSAVVNLNCVTNRAAQGPRYKLSYDAKTIQKTYTLLLISHTCNPRTQPCDNREPTGWSASTDPFCPVLYYSRTDSTTNPVPTPLSHLDFQNPAAVSSLSSPSCRLHNFGSNRFQRPASCHQDLTK